MKTIWLSLAGCALLCACAPGGKDYDAAARCQALGHAPGTEAYDTCVYEEKMQKMMQQQRQEYEKMKQDELDWKLRGQY